MVLKFGSSAFALLLASTAASASPEMIVPLASHRAAYELSLVDPASPAPTSAQAPVAATGLIAYEFRGSACEGYTSNFRQMTQMERTEGDPLSMDVSAMSFEAADGKSMRFRVDSTGGQQTPPVVGTATREPGDDMRVDLTKPAPRTIDFGHDVLFPTQHIERLIESARNGGGVIQARVYDGSDTGAKIYQTMAVIGREASKPSADADSATELKGVRRWPVVVSYFDESSKDSLPEYTLSFDLYENGVSGSLKLDYGTFALRARLRKLEMLPATACAK
jgi:EipB-like